MPIKCSIFCLPFFLSAALYVDSYSQPLWGSLPGGTTLKLNSLVFYDTLNGIAVGDSGKIIATSDGGYSWSHRHGMSHTSFNDVVVAGLSSAIAGGNVDCADAACGVAYRSSDKGIDWHEVASTASINALEFYPSRGGFGAGYAFNGWLVYGYATCYRFNDNDSAWKFYTILINDSTIDEGMADLSYPDENFCMAVTDKGHIYRFLGDTVLADSHGNSYWDLVSSFPGALNGIYFGDTLNGTVVGIMGNIWRTTDGGATWNQQASGVSENLNNVIYISPTEGYIAGHGGTILHTTNSGVSWLREDCGTIVNLNKIFFSGPDHGWVVGDSGTILKKGRFKIFSSGKSAIDFGEIIERESKTDSVTLRNPGTEPLTVSAISSDHPDFFTDQISLTVPPRGERSLKVSFAPTGPGFKSGNICFVHDAFSSPDTVMVEGRALNYDTSTVEIRHRWNLVSNPRIVKNDSVHILFDGASSPAYRYNQVEGYQVAQRILNGEGYWLKSDSFYTAELAGADLLTDTVDVISGWNLIGSISEPVAAGSIVQIPAGIVISEYFTYFGAYIQTSILLPGMAHWVKISQNGKLILPAN